MQSLEDNTNHFDVLPIWRMLSLVIIHKQQCQLPMTTPSRGVRMGRGREGQGAAATPGMLLGRDNTSSYLPRWHQNDEMNMNSGADVLAPWWFKKSNSNPHHNPHPHPHLPGHDPRQMEWSILKVRFSVHNNSFIPMPNMRSSLK